MSGVEVLMIKKEKKKEREKRKEVVKHLLVKFLHDLSFHEAGAVQIWKSTDPQSVSNFTQR